MKQKILFSILVIIFLLPTLVFAVPGIVISNQLTAQFAVEELTVTLGDMPEWINTDSIEIIGSYSGNGITKIELLITRDDQAEPVQELMFDVESRTFSGAYAFPADGVYRFQTVITDLYNNTALSSAAVVKRDSIPPSLGVYCPVAITRNPSVLIKITSEPGAGIYVNGIKRPGSVDEDGSLDVVVDLAVGKNVISFQVEDRAGNRSERIEIYVTRQAGTSSGGGGGGAVQPSAVPALEDKLTLDDHLIYNSLDKTGSAVLSLADRSDGRVVISIAVIREMVMKNLSLTLLGEGIELFFAPMCFITDEIMAAPLGYDAFLELVIREATEEEKTGVFSQVKPGENTGLFDIGGRVFKMEARVYWTNPDGTQTIHPVEHFGSVIVEKVDLGRLNLDPVDLSHLTAVRFKKDGQGKIVPVKLGGNYDPKSKCFSFYSDSFSYYSIMQAAELTRITLHVDKPTIVVNDISKTIDVPPAIINNRTMVPLRLIGENLDARVEWIAETSSVLVMHKEKELRLVIGQTGPGLDSPPIIVNNRTLVPLRYISENLGASVHWIPSTLDFDSCDQILTDRSPQTL